MEIPAILAEVSTYFLVKNTAFVTAIGQVYASDTTPCVMKPVATYAATTDRLHSPAASAGA